MNFEGTPIQALQAQGTLQQAQYSGDQNMHQDLGQAAVQSIQPTQPPQYYDMPTPPPSTMNNLARDIALNMPTGPQPPINYTQQNNTPQNKVTKKLDINLIKEGVLVLVLYVILSQPKVFEFVAKYIPQINSDIITGNPTFIGITIYGLILSVLYMLIKKYLL